MLPLYKFVLGPILVIQARRLRRTALRLPEAAGPRCGREGSREALQPALRILVVGDSSAAGVGVDDQVQALAQPVAKMLAIKLGRPVTWQLVAKSGVNTEESLALLRQSELQPADFLVTALGTNDVTSQRSPRQFLQDYRRLVEEVRRRTGAFGLVATGLPPLRILPAAQHPLRWYLGRYAASLDRTLRRWISQDAAARYISLDWAAKPLEMARDRFHPGAGQYRCWAELVSEQIVDLLVEDSGPVVDLGMCNVKLERPL
ncbi:SGNH/GDSL hydrolase family protein [Burkholderia sp. Bp8994]|nr:SGNH/GDSL hydrolase family protein [Burkholderia sp. Bp9131]RQR65799.1 SGNH/GDSL hydrolase family protein [Burkholderia sp. Bp9015]RQR92894.1 SGNH/GDSL hydrolase family protein [Burkholderia sp. Bp8994]RQS20857.1 SGNH/GDSL hydrolase family protein [Burkholderia sp. Bp8995]RQS37612.1 SGNH/GDSL hydrolase family protein [Burkholderia sp. Bp8990]RQS40644.1 SGNH/GDSL hydrolase family protein [Burkholderia sp. Bp8989]RQS53485.1 SGNH/GDSL hydrolase family protein [Burkholderia sp. Bp8984]